MLSIPTEHLKFWGWRPWQPWSVVEWCGHPIEEIPVPTVDGRGRLIVVAAIESLGEVGRVICTP